MGVCQWRGDRRCGSNYASEDPGWRVRKMNRRRERNRIQSALYPYCEIEIGKVRRRVAAYAIAHAACGDLSHAGRQSLRLLEEYPQTLQFFRAEPKGLIVELELSVLRHAVLIYELERPSRIQIVKVVVPVRRARLILIPQPNVQSKFRTDPPVILHKPRIVLHIVIEVSRHRHTAAGRIPQ